MTANSSDPVIGTIRRRPPVYGMWRILGTFDVDAFRRSVDIAAVRTGFVRPNERGNRVAVVELGGGVLGDVVRAEFGGGFDVGVGPLVRVLVVRCGVGVHVVVVTLHQLVADRVSLGLFVGELVGVYGSLVSGAAGDSAGDGAVSGAGDGGGGVGFGDVVGWQRGGCVGGVCWGGWCGGVFVWGVGGLAARLGVDPWVVLLAGWGLVLARCSGVADFAVGVPVAGWREGVSGVVGPLVNVVPVRLGYESGLSFERWVGVVGQWVGAARLRGRVPFERIVEAVGPGRDLSRSPLFQVFFGSERERGSGF